MHVYKLPKKLTKADIEFYQKAVIRLHDIESRVLDSLLKFFENNIWLVSQQPKNQLSRKPKTNYDPLYDLSNYSARELLNYGSITMFFVKQRKHTIQNPVPKVIDVEIEQEDKVYKKNISVLTIRLKLHPDS